LPKIYQKYKSTNPQYNSMKYLVCISKTPETTAKIAFTNNNSEFDQSGVQFILNPYDEWYALVRAIELVEAQGGTVTVINVGTSDNDAIIRKALAIGAHNAVRIDSQATSALFVAKQIADHCKANAYDVILCGKETIDFNGSEVGGMIAEYLDVPYVSYATSLEINGAVATVERDIEGGSETSTVQTPCVISAAKGMAEQRIPNMKGIMMAKNKPLEVKSATPFTESTSVVQFTMPNAKTGVKMIDPDNMDELVRLLHEEAKVL
jgi:electron transfer flavoprotein beta subunit